MEAQLQHIPTPEVLELKESIKLLKNSKGYNWEIRILNDGRDIESLCRLELLNTEMMKRFGSLSA